MTRISLPADEAVSLVLSLRTELRELEQRKEFLWDNQLRTCVHLVMDHHATIAEVARNAGINRQTLYRAIRLEKVRRGIEEIHSDTPQI